MPLTPEQQAREKVDEALAVAGWIAQDRDEMNLGAGLGVAVREFKMAPGHGFADYMLFVDGQAAGVLEAKPVGYTLLSVELQADKYATGLPAGQNPPVNPLPFLYVSTGVDTRFINGLDPDPKSRRISHLPHIHRPETLAQGFLYPVQVPRRSEQPRRAGGEGVPGLPDSGRSPEVHRALHRPAPDVEHHRRGQQSGHHHDPAPLLDAQGGARLRGGRRSGVAVRLS